MIKSLARALTTLSLVAASAIPCLAADEPAKETAAVSAAAADVAQPGDNTPPAGYVALFNGKDLTGWKGLMGAPLDNPAERAKASPEQLAKSTKYANGLMKQHWSVKDGILIYDGKGKSLATVKDYGDFEMLVDWKILPAGDSGIYLRGTPQVQIWDPDKKPASGVGSGGLYNNVNGPSTPLKKADKPVGEWNTFHIVMIGDEVTVKLNGAVVVEKAKLTNFFERGTPLPEKGPIELQYHGDPLWFKNVYIKELP